MEKRLLLAIVLSFLVLFGYQAFFAPKPPPPETIPEAPAQVVQQPSVQPATKQPEPQRQAEEPAEASQEIVVNEDIQPIGDERETDVVIDTPLYRAIWSNKGAVLKSWRLKEHKDENGEDLELVAADAREIRRFPFALQSGDPEFNQLINAALFKPSRLSLDMGYDQVEEIRFTYADQQGNRAEKIFTFKGGKYDFDIQTSLWKNGQQIEPGLVWGPKFGNLSPVASGGRMGSSSPGISVYAGAKVERHEERKYDPATSTYNFVNWAGYDDQYFTALLVSSSQGSIAVFSQEIINQIPYYFLEVTQANHAFLGPKQFDLLTEFGHESKRIIKFGIFGFIAEILYVGMKEVHKVIPNWGIAIIFITLITKIVFFPLTYQSTKSMAKMQELQPKLKALKSKYKKAKQDIEQRRKLNEETMKMYKAHGVNPAGGCLPMLVQLPIFWGFFRLLLVAVEFRQSPFAFWITDLSLKDPYYITPILMGLTQFINQKMTPTTGDATQQRMMLIMPVIMTIFFINFPSGLVLYWLTNNVLQIGQQYIFNRIRQKQKKEPHGKQRKK